MRRRPHLMSDVLLALGKAEVVEQMLFDKDPDLNILGVLEGQRITINPLHHKRQKHVVATLLHEAIHYVRRAWSEGKVRQAERELMEALTLENREAIYKLYQLVVKKRKGARKV